jgi:hypothetical protein
MVGLFVFVASEAGGEDAASPWVVRERFTHLLLL